MYLQIYIYIHIHIYFFNWKFLQPRYIGPGHGGPNKCTVMCTEGLYRSMVFVGVSKWWTVPATRFHSGITPALSKLCRLGWIMNEISPPLPRVRLHHSCIMPTEVSNGCHSRPFDHWARPKRTLPVPNMTKNSNKMRKCSLLCPKPFHLPEQPNRFYLPRLQVAKEFKVAKGSEVSLYFGDAPPTQQ